MSITPIEIETANEDLPQRIREAIAATSSGRLWAIGSVTLLAQPLVGMACSSECPGPAISQTYDIALAIRKAGLSVISGFHSPMEQEVLAILLRGTQPTVICPARGISGMRLHESWRSAIDANRLLVASPFGEQVRRQTKELARQRTRLVASLSTILFVPHAAPGSATEKLCLDRIAAGQTVVTFDSNTDRRLLHRGALGMPPAHVVNFLQSHLNP